MSYYFEEFEVGAVYESRGRTITEADVVMFACLSGDFIELHVNKEYAQRSVFGQRIVHGTLTFSISTGLAAQMDLINDTVIAFYGVDGMRFTKPVFIGDTIRVKKQCVARQEKGPDRGVIEFDTKVVNQAGETVLVYRDKVLMKRKKG